MRHCASCRLAFPGDFAEAPADTMPDFGAWTIGVRACILEALQSELRSRWIDAEIGKAQRTAWKELRAIGQAQEQVLTAYCEALEAAGRRDLARFILEAAVELLGTADNAYAWM